MPRYYFDLLDGDILAVYEEGLELPNLRPRKRKPPKRGPTWRGTPSIIRLQLPPNARDAEGPVMPAKFTFEIERSKH